MAVYTDFFLATEDGVRRAFAGWAAPGASAPVDDAPPPDLTGLAVLQMKSVDSLVLAQLLVAADGGTLSDAIAQCSRPGSITPPNFEGSLFLIWLPERLVAILTTTAGAERERLSASWEARLLADFASIPNVAAAAFETQRWTGQCIRIFDGLAGLLAARKPGESLYVLVTV